MKNNLFQRADFSGDSSVKEQIFRKMKQAEETAKIVPMSRALSDDDLMYVSAAGTPDLKEKKTKEDK